ncbi:unnamed protein product [Trifolium pratense]|uniref:Uncharacterized protein n=1 Tax=Trifolium pratense TaxID=57577 RepID=A0ACB0JKV9_TRIPR|nr:unnamed protein product [Trifolium pratense]
MVVLVRRSSGLFLPLRTLTKLAKSIGSGIELHQYPSLRVLGLEGKFALWSLWSYDGLQAWVTSYVVDLWNFGSISEFDALQNLDHVSKIPNLESSLPNQNPVSKSRSGVSLK